MFILFCHANKRLTDFFELTVKIMEHRPFNDAVVMVGRTLVVVRSRLKQ